MESVKHIFSSNLKALLKRDALLPNHLAQRLEVAASVVKRWVDGASIPEANTIDKIRSRFGWSLVELFGEEHDEKQPSPAKIAAYVNSHPELFATSLKVIKKH